MTCSHVNKNDGRIVTIRNYSSRGMYFESDEAALIGSYIVLRAMGTHEMEALASLSDPSFPFSMENSDPLACRGYRSHTVAKVVRCDRIVEATRFGIGAEVLILSDWSERQPAKLDSSREWVATAVQVSSTRAL
jgi:hypothetical protein